MKIKLVYFMENKNFIEQYITLGKNSKTINKIQDLYLFFKIDFVLYKLFFIKSNVHVPMFNPILETPFIFKFRNIFQFL